MADMFSRRKRSDIMSKIRSRDTTPELASRKALRTLGLRFGVCRRSLPGTPDIVLRQAQAAVFVHGCFWHQHKGCRRCSMPTSNQVYWQKKLTRNVERFAEVKSVLRKDGWRVVVIWNVRQRIKASFSGYLELNCRSIDPLCVGE
jgi:DNA mismatch endonuclease, patch repair protein